jgi:hypothetical protein
MDGRWISYESYMDDESVDLMAVNAIGVDLGSRCGKLGGVSELLSRAVVG